MSYGVFVNIPDIPGTSTVKGHEKEIEAKSFTYGVAHPHDRGLSSGERVHQDIVLNKNTDEASALLMLACCNGKQFDKITFDFFRVDRGAASQKFASITIKHAIVSNWKMVAAQSSGTAEPQEEVWFGFQEIDVTIHNKQASDAFRVLPGQHK